MHQMQRFVERVLAFGGIQDGERGEDQDGELEVMSGTTSSSASEDGDSRIVCSWEDTREDVRQLLESARLGDAHGVLCALRQGVNINSTG